MGVAVRIAVVGIFIVDQSYQPNESADYAFNAGLIVSVVESPCELYHGSLRSIVIYVSQ